MRTNTLHVVLENVSQIWGNTKAAGQGQRNLHGEPGKFGKSLEKTLLLKSVASLVVQMVKHLSAMQETRV